MFLCYRVDETRVSMFLFSFCWESSFLKTGLHPPWPILQCSLLTAHWGQGQWSFYSYNYSQCWTRAKNTKTRQAPGLDCSRGLELDTSRIYLDLFTLPNPSVEQTMMHRRNFWIFLITIVWRIISHFQVENVIWYKKVFVKQHF